MIKKLNKKTVIVVLVVFSIQLIFSSLLFIKGEDSVIEIHDSLDSNVLFNKVIVDNNAHFLSSYNLIDGMIGLQFRGLYPSEFTPELWIHTFFNPFTAYAVNFAFVNIVGFIGMFLLLFYIFRRNSVDEEHFHSLILALIGALIFSMFKFWSHAGISVAGIPLLIYGILKLDIENSKYGYFIVAFYTIYSSLILSGLFVLTMYLTFIVMSFFILKKATKTHFWSILLMIFIYLIANYRMIEVSLFSDFTSHRANFNKISEVDTDMIFTSLINTFTSIILNGHYHAANFFKGISIIALFFSVFFVFKCNYKVKIYNLVAKLYLIFLVIVIVFSNIVIKNIFNSIPIIKMFQWDRFYFLLPPLTLITFMIAVYYLSTKINKKLLYIGLICLSFYGFYLNDNWKDSLKIGTVSKTASTFEDFYKVRLFGEVKLWLESNNYSRVVALGYHPAINIYNNIKSFDGYLPSYAIDSKDKMLSIINSELELNNKMKNYFINWGNRCYFFNSEMPVEKLYKIDSSISFNRELFYNWKSARNNGIDYVLSFNKINIKYNSDLELAKTFTNYKDVVLYCYKISI